MGFRVVEGLYPGKTDENFGKVLSLHCVLSVNVTSDAHRADVM